MRFRFLVTLIVGLALAAIPSAAGAATITVNTKADTSVSFCTLRDAIDAANANAASGQCPHGDPGPTVDTINFAVTPGDPPITLGTPLPNITGSLNIVGPGASQLTVSGGDAVRVLQINSGTVTISGLTIADGFCDSTCDDGAVGAGILNNAALTLSGVTVSDNEANDDNDPSSPEGGGIFNQEVLTIVNSTVRDNSATTSGATSNHPNGGGIFNNDTLTLDRSTVSGNDSTATGSGVGSTTSANGGGIHNSRTLNMSRSTLSGNTVTGTGGMSNSASGGGMSTSNSAAVHLNISHSTVSGNTASITGSGQADSGGLGIFTQFGTVAVTSSTVTANSAPIGANVFSFPSSAAFKSTIVSNPQGGGDNCDPGGVDSQGYNLEELTGTCGFGEPTDHPNSSPAGLDPNLTANGGPTETHALLAGSLAIDQGSGSCTTDQRGQPSPSDVNGVANAPGGAGTDIGAFERQDSNPPGTTITSGLANGSQTKSRSQTFGFTATEACSTFQCRVDAGPFSGCTSPHTTAALADGGHTFSVRALDGGNHADASPAARMFTIDATGPETEITKAPKKKVKTRKKRKKAKFTFSSTESPSSFECSLDDGGFDPCTSPFKAKVKKGKHSFEVRATDGLGNADATPAKHKWKVKRKRR